MRIHVIAAGIMATLASGAQDSLAAEMVLTGGDFLSSCSQPNSEWIGFCHGYVQGVFDNTPSGEFCVPPGTTRADLVGRIVIALTEEPKLQDAKAASVVRLTLQKAYPCA